MMIWQIEWKALSANIASLVETGRFIVAAAQVNSSDPYQARRTLLVHAQQIFNLIDGFRQKYSHQLPQLAEQGLENFFCERNASMFTAEIAQGNADTQFHRLQICIALLSSFRAEFTYLLSDEKEVLVRSLVDRAFLHLQRSIVADRTLAEKWKEAFGHHETACEKLGGRMPLPGR
jgi:hypothetical protein